MKILIGFMCLGSILSGCAGSYHRDAYHTETSSMGILPVHHHIINEKSVVAYDPKKDAMTETGVVVRMVDSPAVVVSSVGMGAPATLLGPGDYYEKRYSPSIFK